jgi:two-component system, cell cycle sensor histidine kinase and response regulator CckA
MTTPTNREISVDEPTARVRRLRSVLLVDDDPVQRKLGGIRLAHAGYLVESASSGAEALERARREPPDVILSDVVMGEIDGFALCRMIRRTPGLEHVPIVLSSAHYQGEADRVLAEHVGAYTLVARMPDFEAELAAIERCLAVPRRDRSLPSPQNAYEQHLQAATTQLSRMVGRVDAACERYHALIENTTDVVTVIEADGRIVEANRRWTEALGYQADELVGHHISEFAAIGAVESNTEAYRQSVEDGGGVLTAIPLRHKDGRTVYFEFTMTTFQAEGRTTAISIGRDVSGRIESARRLAASEARYRTLVENMPDVLWSMAPDDSLMFISPNAQRILGYAVEALLARPWLGSEIHPDDRDRVLAALETARRGEGGFDAEYRMLRPEGTWMWIRNRSIGTHLDGGIACLDGLVTDVTERKHLEDQLRQAQRLEAIGQLSGGIAHDFNNLLAVIMAHSEFLLEELVTTDPRHDDAVEIKHAGERAVGLTRQLLAFSRRQMLEPTTANLDQVIGGLEKMLRRLIGEDIALAVRRTADLGTVRVDVGQIEQVVMNLVVNARDAMPTGGQLAIDTANVEIDDLAAGQAGCPPGSYVMFSVSDSGCGMDAATRARVFEPFFTTKAVGRGTGLGLSTCYGIVKQSGGSISVYSELGHGTVFKVYLPRIAGAVARPQRRSSSVALGGLETILLVEDDARVRGAVARMLETRGYDVLVVPDGCAAVEVVQRQASLGRPIHLVLSDVVMPGRCGPETVAQLSAVMPGIRALYMSGYSDHAILRDGVLQDGTQFIQKPFTRDALARKVRDVLDAALAD